MKKKRLYFVLGILGMILCISLFTILRTNDMNLVSSTPTSNVTGNKLGSSPLAGEENTVTYSFTNLLFQLNQMDLSHFWEITTTDNFFYLDDHVLYYTSKTASGPSEIKLEYPDKSVELLFEIDEFINKLYWITPYEMIIEVNAYFYPDDTVIKYYSIDLQNSLITPANLAYPVEEVSLTGLHDRNIWYKGNRFFITLNENPIGPEDKDIYIEVENEGFSCLAEHAVSDSIIFSENKIYYKTFGPSSYLYSVDFDGIYTEVLDLAVFGLNDFGISKPYYIGNNSLVTLGRGPIYLSDLDTLEYIVLEVDTLSSPQIDEDVMYALCKTIQSENPYSTSDSFLIRIDENGDIQTLLDSFNVNQFWVRGKDIYYMEIETSDVYSESKLSYYWIAEDGIHIPLT